MSAIPHHTSDPRCPLCEQKLLDAHPTLVGWFEDVKSRNPNVHVSWGFRDATSQAQAVQEGKSKLLFPNSAHNKQPALALDLFQIDESGRAFWDPVFFAKLAGEIADSKLPLKWGGHWKGLGDNDHFEVVLDG